MRKNIIVDCYDCQGTGIGYLMAPRCFNCDGKGYFNVTVEVCDLCNGEGKIDSATNCTFTGDDEIINSVTCPKCEGEGNLVIDSDDS